MVTMMEQVAYEANLTNQEQTGQRPSPSKATPPCPLTPSRRARLQMASPRPKVLHHQRSVGHYGEDDSEDADNEVQCVSDKAIRTSEFIATPTSSFKATPKSNCQSSSSPNRCNNLSKLRTEAFLNPLLPSNATPNSPQNLEISSNLVVLIRIHELYSAKTLIDFENLETMPYTLSPVVKKTMENHMQEIT